MIELFSKQPTKIRSLIEKNIQPRLDCIKKTRVTFRIATWVQEYTISSHSISFKENISCTNGHDLRSISWYIARSWYIELIKYGTKTINMYAHAVSERKASAVEAIGQMYDGMMGLGIS